MLEDLKVRDLIGKRDNVYFVNADDTSDVAALKLRNFKVRTIGVMENGKLVGVVGQSDFSTKVVAMGRNPSDVRVSEIMSKNLFTVNLDTSFFECLKLMDTHRISHLIILDEEERYYGMLSWRDLQQRLVKELKYQLKITQEYAFGPHVGEVITLSD
ncbi:MAG TPA: CBS domain-containing protein [Thermodesulfobacteriota bacterium]|nr:CBS domain-containing protein [Thermodesulfobacteriota bacterium]